MPSATYVTNLSVGGITIQPPPVVRSGDHPNPYEVTLPAGGAGELTTRTDDDTGIVTMESGHGIEGGDVVDVYWNDGANRRYGMTVDEESSSSGSQSSADELLVLPLDGGTGDALPVAATALVVTKHVNINTAIDGDNIVIIGIMLECALDADAVGHISFFDANDNEICEFDLAKDDPLITDVEGGAANSFAGAPITYARATNGSSSQDATLKILSLEDSTPA